MNATTVYNTVDFFNAYNKKEPDTWIVWIDKNRGDS